MAGSSHLFFGVDPLQPPRFSAFLSFYIHIFLSGLSSFHSLTLQKVLTAISLLSLFYFQSFSVHIRSVSFLDILLYQSLLFA